MPLGKEYACALATPDVKADLIEFAVDTFMQSAKEELHVGQSVLIDSPPFEQPFLLSPRVRCEKLPKSKKAKWIKVFGTTLVRAPFLQ